MVRRSLANVVLQLNLTIDGMCRIVQGRRAPSNRWQGKTWASTTSLFDCPFHDDKFGGKSRIARATELLETFALPESDSAQIRGQGREL